MFEKLRGIIAGGRGTFKEEKKVKVEDQKTLARREQARALMAQLLGKKLEEVGDNVRLIDLFGPTVEPHDVIGLLVVNGYGDKRLGSLRINNTRRDTVKDLLGQIDS